MGVEVEVLLLRTTDAGLAWRRVTAAGVAQGAGSPDESAAAVARSARLVHSTSWRFVASDRPHDRPTVVLTYVAAPDPDLAQPATPLGDVGVLSSGDPRHPTPEFLHPHHVAAHAVLHLAGLAARDPAVMTAMRDASTAAIVRACVAAADRMVTGTHAAAHGSGVPDLSGCP